MKLEAHLLALLQQSPEGCSGQALSREMGVSRSAVWKHVNRLREAGYEITSAPGRGYALRRGYLDAAAITRHLTTRTVGREIYIGATVSSTNDRAREQSGQAGDGAVFCAERQLQGRGRLGRTWDSPMGEGLFMSVLQYPALPPMQVMGLTLCAGLAVCRGIEDVTGVQAMIKWPNDIVLEGKKLCGILAEMQAEAERIVHVVIGIGINVNQEAFPEELSQKGISLRQATGRAWDRNALAAAVCNRLEEYEELLFRGAFPMAEYRERCVTLHREVRVCSVAGEYTARAVEVTENGELVVELPDGSRRTVGAGEVSVRGLFGYAE